MINPQFVLRYMYTPEEFLAVPAWNALLSSKPTCKFCTIPKVVHLAEVYTTGVFYKAGKFSEDRKSVV